MFKVSKAGVGAVVVWLTGFGAILSRVPPELQAIALAICVFNFGLWLFLWLALNSLFQQVKLVLEKEIEIMSSQANALTKQQFLDGITAAVNKLKADFQTALDTEKQQIIDALTKAQQAGVFTESDLAGVVSLIQGVGSTAIPTLDKLSDTVAAQLGGSGGTGGGTPQP